MGLFIALSWKLCIIIECWVSENSCQECIIFRETTFSQNFLSNNYSKEECRANTCWGRGRDDACSRSLCSALVHLQFDGSVSLKLTFDLVFVLRVHR